MHSRLALGLTLQYAIGGSFLPFLVQYFRDRGLSREVDIPVIFTGVAVVSATMPILWGVLADRFVAVNRLIALLHVVGASSLLIVASSESFAMIFLGTILWYSCGLPTNALLNALCYHNLASPKAEFGRLRMWGSVGWILPSLPVAIWLSWSETGDLDFLLYFGAAVQFLFVLLSPLLPFTPPPHRLAPAGDAGEPRVSFARALGQILPRPEFLLLLVVSFLMFWSFNIVFYYSPVYLVEEAGVPREWIMPIQSLGPVLEIPLFFLLPRILARIGFFATLACGCVIMLVRQALYAASTDPVLLSISYVLVGAAVVFYLITVSLKIDAMAGREVRSSAQTMLLISSHGLGTLVAHLTTGQLFDGEDPTIFALGVGLAALALVFLAAAALFERRRAALAAVRGGVVVGTPLDSRGAA